MLYQLQMGRDMTRLTNTLSVTNDQGYDNVNQYFMSQMTRDMTRLTDTLYVKNDQGYDKVNQ